MAEKSIEKFEITIFDIIFEPIYFSDNIIKIHVHTIFNDQQWMKW